MNALLVELRRALLATAVLMVVLCGIYPGVVWGLARVLFAEEADGSLVYRGRDVIGSSLIGQPFRGAGYFHGRPSAAGSGYDAAASGGTNLGPLSRKLLEAVAERARSYREENSLDEGAQVPVDAVTASGSGLDPHISLENALLQLPRIAAARRMSRADLLPFVRRNLSSRDFGFLGEPRVNVFLLNRDLDREGASR